MLIYIVFFLLLIITIKDQLKAALILFISYPTIFPFLIEGYSIHTILTIILFVLWRSKYRRRKHNNNDNFNFRWVFILCLVSYLISSVLDLSSTSILNVLGGFTIFMLIYIIYKDYNPTEDINRFYLLLVFGYFAILILVGTYEAFSTEHPFSDLLSAYDIEIPEPSDNSVRTGFNRTQSLTVWCEAYGAVLILCISTACCLLQKKLIRSVFGYGLIFFALFGALTTNSRTIFAGAILSALAILPMFLKKKSDLLIIAVFALFFLFIFGDVLLQFFEILINHEDSGGSSLVMRLGQFAMSMYIISDNLLFGQGLSNISSIIADYKDIGLYGAESVVFTTLLGRGLFGLFTLIYAFVTLIRETIKNNVGLLLYMIMAFTFIKVFTLCYSIHEFYIFGYYIPLYFIINNSNKNPKNESIMV